MVADSNSGTELKMVEKSDIDREASSFGEKIDGIKIANSVKVSWIGCCLISAWPFTIHFGLFNLVTTALGSYLASQLTTIEKQFGLSSAQSGVLASMNDLGFWISVLFVTYLGRNSHIPRILGVCGLLYGLSSFIAIIPHFFAHHDLGSYQTGNNLTSNVSSRNMGQLCVTETPEDPSLNDLICAEKDKPSTSAESLAIGLISIGMILQGAANSARQPLSSTYLDDNVPNTESGFYIGIVLFFALCGPVIAYSIGGSISRIYVTLEETDMSPRDPRFIGAWWLGFVVFGTAAMVLSLPLFCYPKSMLSNRKDSKASEKLPRKAAPKRKIASIKGALLAFKRLAVRPVYMFQVAWIGIQSFSIAGISAFMPKFMQIHYGLSIYKSSIVIGFVRFGMTALSIFLGGVLSRALKLEQKGMLKTIIIAQIVSSGLFFLGFFMACPQPPIQDFNINNIRSNVPMLSSANSSHSCYAACHCAGANFFPICGSDGVTYFSPCHAGCSGTTKTGYKDCLCINSTESKTKEGSQFDAVPGMCKHECPLYIGFIVIQLLSNFVSGLGVVPTLLSFMRAVDERDKSLALGAASFVASLFGFFLGPMVMGSIIDTTCKLWNTSCSKDGSCALYDIADVRVKVHAFDCGLSIAYISMVILAYLCVGRFPKTENISKPSNEGKGNKQRAVPLQSSMDL